jgi:serine/threonine protein kinase
MIGYTNKSYYTAPELLSERGNIVSNPTTEGDVYSLGMVLYEMFNEKIPFKVVKILIILIGCLLEGNTVDHYHLEWKA